MGSCTECCFKIEEQDVQIGCSISKLDKIKSKYNCELKDGVYHFDRMCPGARTDRWREKHSDRDLKEVLAEEAAIRPAIFVPIRTMEEFEAFDKNYKDLIEIAPLVNILNYSGGAVRSYDLVVHYDNNAKINVTFPTISLNPDYVIYQNILNIKKFRYYQMIVVDDVFKAPRPDLCKKIYSRINDEIDYIVGVVGDGYYFIYKNLFCQLVAHGSPIFEFLKKHIDLEDSFVLNEREL